jgi:hypothetical protein
MAARKGEVAVTGFALKNGGDYPIEFRVMHEGRRPDVLTTKNVIVHPMLGTVPPHQTINIAVHVETKDYAVGIHPLQVVILTNTDQELKVPLTLQIRSTSENLKALIKKYW